MEKPFFGQRREILKLKKWLDVELSGTLLFSISLFHNVAFYFFLLFAGLFIPKLLLTLGYYVMGFVLLFQNMEIANILPLTALARTLVVFQRHHIITKFN